MTDAATTASTRGAALEATFTGEATITTDFNPAQGPFVAAIKVGLKFTSSTVVVTTFPPIRTRTFDTPFGPNRVTVTKMGGGSGTFTNGSIALPLKLKFDHSAELPNVPLMPPTEEDSTLSLTLRTSGPGSPVEPDGDVTLVGSGTFSGGVLDARRGTLKIKGRISPSPVN
ncbi:hypothetical protein SAMN05660464_4066 [Geodermatophilus dictyosporus]|uniref:Uncharacterized protein n=1 Tax=Geodermatophilus dictyosporus TaxID=1523247 RepID=A0A1I5SUG6_9ACTN|nr:hypothetical protein [Geodermatophilus dictyosporus]SFP74412.1 hypothetical protein SAMN05660464_4066 [Geodermatophilus dictyosporus]